MAAPTSCEKSLCESKSKAANDFIEYDSNDYPKHFFSRWGYKLQCYTWLPKKSHDKKISPRALVYISHGVGEHSGWYSCLTDPLTERNLLVFAHDHVGNGRSEGPRVHIDEFSTYSADVLRHADLLLKIHPGLPLFIVGHSMGGTVAVSAAVERPGTFTGVVLLAPALAPNPRTTTPFRVRLAKGAAWLMPQLQVGKIERDAISRDPAVADAYDADPDVWHGGLKAHWACEMLRQMAWLDTQMAAIRWPFLTLHSRGDQLCEVSGSIKLYETAASEDKTLKVFEEGEHQIHHELPEMAKEVNGLIVDWIERRCDTSN